jgi:hypothetical protein
VRQPIHFVPILTTLFAVYFGWMVWKRYRERRTGPHLAWWAAGIFLYGVGTLTEASVTLFGWSPGLFRSWYISGALLGGAPLAQGTVYLLFSRKTANRMTAVIVPYILIASVFVLLTPINYALVEPHRLTGAVMEWSWVRLFSPWINLYALIFLVGGAALSAWRFGRNPATANRAWGNALIALGAMMPAIGGTATRMGYTEVLYAAELVGLLLIWMGYLLNVRDTVARPEPAPRPSPTPATTTAAAGD